MYVCAENSPHCFSSTVVLRTYDTTYILWATAGTTGIVLNLRSRNTKKTQTMRVTQQQHSTAQAVKLQQ